MAGCHDDQSLIDACRAGRTEAFGELVRRYQDRLYATVTRLVGRSDEAEDLVAEAFYRAYRNLQEFQGDSSFYTWVYRIAVNLALSHQRHLRVVSRFWSKFRDQRADPADPTHPGELLERSELASQVQAALNGLPPDQRSVLVLRYYDGLRYDEIAETLGIPIGTVRSRLSRAHVELKTRLQGVLEEVPAPQDHTT